MQSYKDVIQFWFVDHGQDDWFGGKPEFDAALAERFADLHPKVARGEAWAWREEPEGRLAEIIVLDQFSRQLHRGSPVAFAQDKMAIVLAQEAIAGGHDMAVDRQWVLFFYMPFMHAESLVIQNEGVRLFEAMDNEYLLKFMVDHRDTIARFGRFPFRNKALGRQSTPEELAYMQEQGDRVF
ncbi:DUF924 domain-containing protein [Devosia sp. XJ19-1]|uniref:DUF924 domain-containing protein n=1 Tax=Devosia ureilytica TaxID=2952754 RepID=A0A9Q4ASG9_9HYPH|nr:DUF924 family protein [Devosia ureilytica]MCP8885090.1 DUF924 domain-containing protein [Devosia ureilytica]MCP8888813.1 DUF924 domain-containing protein [Devosia ureilytica]